MFWKKLLKIDQRVNKHDENIIDEAHEEMLEKC